MPPAPLVPTDASCQTSHITPKEPGDRPALPKVDMESLFDDDDGDDTFDLISGLNSLSSATDSTVSTADLGESALLNHNSGRDSASQESALLNLTSGRGSSSHVSSECFDRTHLSGEKNLASSSCVGGSAENVKVDVVGALSSRGNVDNVFVVPKRPSFASKNSGRYSGGGMARRKKSFSEGNGRV